MNNRKLTKKNSIDGLVRRLLVGVSLGVVVAAIILLIGDVREVAKDLGRLSGRFLFWAFALTFVSYLLRLWKWHLFTRWCDFRVSFRENAVIFFIGLMMSITPGKAGELIKAYFLEKRAGVEYAKSVPIVIYDRLTDVLAMVVLIGVGLFVYPFGLPVFGLFMLGLIAFFIVVQRRVWMRRFIDWVGGLRMFGFGLSRFRVVGHRLYDQLLFLLQGRFLSISFFISLAAWFLECVSLYLIVVGFGLDVSLVASVLTFSLGTVAGVLSMIPGGLGAAEGSIAGLLMYFGVGGGLALTISLIIRFVTLWFGVLLGIVVFLVKRKEMYR